MDWKLRFLHGDSRLDTATRAIRFFGPFAVEGAALGTLYLLGGKFASIAFLTLLYALAPPGRLVLLAAPGFGVDPLFLFPPILLFDLMGSLFILMNFYLAEQAPWIGKLVRKAEKTAHAQMKKRKWLEELAWVGVVIFVFLPFLGTNAIVGTIVGRFLKMKDRHIIAAVMLGSFLGLLAVVGPAYFAFGLTR